MSAELVNSPTFNSQNNGFFQFVSDDYARMPNNTTLDTQTPSVEVWIKTNATSQSGFWFEKGTVNTQYSLFQSSVTLLVSPTVPKSSRTRRPTIRRISAISPATS